MQVAYVITLYFPRIIPYGYKFVKYCKISVQHCFYYAMQNTRLEQALWLAGDDSGVEPGMLVAPC